MVCLKTVLRQEHAAGRVRCAGRMPGMPFCSLFPSIHIIHHLSLSYTFVRTLLQQLQKAIFSSLLVPPSCAPWGIVAGTGPAFLLSQHLGASRFFLGGVSNGLQGFSFKGAGPTDKRRAVRHMLPYIYGVYIASDAACCMLYMHQICSLQTIHGNFSRRSAAQLVRLNSQSLQHACSMRCAASGTCPVAMQVRTGSCASLSYASELDDSCCCRTAALRRAAARGGTMRWVATRSAR